MYLAIINVPGYLSNQDEFPEFDTCAEAWEYLIDERLRDLEDPLNDQEDLIDTDNALDEMGGMVLDPEVGTVYGTTPGYEGDHDLGLAYSVVQTDLINRY